jgi:hypothetical protein
MKGNYSDPFLRSFFKNRVTGANDKIRVGFIGVGNRGTQVLHLFINEPDFEIAGL